MRSLLIGQLIFFLLIFHAKAQYLDQFSGDSEIIGKTPAGWSVASGDGNVSINFIQQKDFASIIVDATGDKRNIWWAIIRRQIQDLDVKKLIKPENELRVEAKIRVSHAPRRVNLHFNHQRTTDFHSHLMEYDIPDTINWHTISMTTSDFEVQTGDKINVQMALMDWGTEKYRIDIDYLKVDVVSADMIRQDKGAKIPYHPPVPGVSAFKKHLIADQDVIIDSDYPEMNFNNWITLEDQQKMNLITVSGTQTVLLSWDFSELKGMKTQGAGLLELTTHSLQRDPGYEKDFGMVRITEILGGKSNWKQGEITYNSFLNGSNIGRVLNSQMIIDYSVNERQDGKTWFTISGPVLQRMIDGTTRGLAIRPLGAVIASFYATENDCDSGPVLHLNIK